MPASYPTSAKSFTTKSNGQAVDASHVDDLQAEVTAIEVDLIAGLPVGRGGTGNQTLTSHGVVLGQGASALVATTAGTAGQALISGGASADPSFQDIVDPGICCGRLTLTPGTAVTSGDVTGATSVVFTPYKGNDVALYNGTLWLRRAFVETSLALGTVVNGQAYDVFAYDNAGTLSLEMLEWANAAVTMTIAAPGVVTWTAHGMSTGMTIIFTNSGGALPTGVTANTVYWITVVDANTFKLSTTLANVAAATFVTTSGSQSGTHTGHQPQARATALALQNGVLTKTGDATRRYLGAFLTTSTTTTEDSATKRFLANAYHQKLRALLKLDTTASWAYDGVMRQARATAANKVEILNGLVDESIDLRVIVNLDQATAAANLQVGIGEDSTTTAAAASDGGGSFVAIGQGVALSAHLVKVPTVGYHAYVWLEGSSASTTTWRGAANVSGGAASGLTGTVRQ